MSLANGEPKFPAAESTATTIPPSPTRENPTGVYPRSSPTPATPQSIPGTGRPRTSKFVLANPYLFAASLNKLEGSLTEVIAVFEKELLSDTVTGLNDEEKMLLDKFKGWRQELIVIRNNRTGIPQRATGHDHDQALQAEITPSGLFAD